MECVVYIAAIISIFAYISITAAASDSFLMTILFHANRFPYPPFRGDKLKIYNLCLRLSKVHELHLITFLEDESDIQYLPELRKIFKEIHLVPLPKGRAIYNTFKTLFNGLPLQVGYFHMQSMQKKIDTLCKAYHYDAVHIQHIRLAPYWQHRSDMPRILDLPDAFSLYWERRANNSKGFKKFFERFEYKRLLKYEKVLNNFQLSLVCSKEDLNYLKEKQGIRNIAILPNGVDTQTFKLNPHDYTINNTLLFTGNMDYAPNVDAVLYFVEDILPIIKKACPDVQFIIAGQRPVPKVQALHNEQENVQVTGFIPNIADMYTTATVVVAPLRIGAGTQNKVLEAMAMGVPVVSRNIGFEGLDVDNGEGVYLKMTAHEFAEQCIILLQNETERMRCGNAGQSVIKNRYAWEKVAAQLDAYFEEITSYKA